MAILVINAGSSSLKLTLYGNKGKQSKTINGSADAKLPELLKQFCQGENVRAVGHRIVHGGDKFAGSVIVDDTVIKDLRTYIELDPSHEAANIQGIEQARQAFPEAVHVAVFDTTYHHDMPLASQVYPGPYSWFSDRKIRRYGFHGINHQYCAEKAVIISKMAEGRIITCHLGSGGSLCASHKGKSLMTTMGYTPLEGLMMRTRSGSIDPGIILVLLKHGFDGAKLNHILNEESGLKGIAGLEGDMREIEKTMQKTSPGATDLPLSPQALARLAFDIYEQNLAANISALVPILGGLDLLVFTGGIGEHSALVRSTVCARLNFLGVELDAKQNEKGEGDRDISSAQARVKTLVIAAGEDLSIARQCQLLCPPAADCQLS